MSGRNTLLDTLNTGANVISAVKNSQTARATEAAAATLAEQTRLLKSAQDAEALHSERRETLFQIGKRAEQLHARTDFGAHYSRRHMLLELGSNGITSANLQMRDDKESLYTLEQSLAQQISAIETQNPAWRARVDELLHIRYELGGVLQRAVVLQHVLKMPRVPTNRGGQIVWGIVTVGLLLSAIKGSPALLIGAAVTGYQCWKASRKVIDGLESLPDWMQTCLPEDTTPEGISTALVTVMRGLPPGDAAQQLDACEAKLRAAHDEAPEIEEAEWLRP